VSAWRVVFDLRFRPEPARPESSIMEIGLRGNYLDRDAPGGPEPRPAAVRHGEGL
jgi:hypothetical protein